MSEPESDPLATGHSTDGAVNTAPGAAQGQADGSPPAGETPTSDGNGQSEDAKELRRRLTEQGEEIKNLKSAATILDRAMQTKAWASVLAEAKGEPEPGGPDPDVAIFGEDPDNLAKGKEWKRRLKEEVRQEFLRDMKPVVQGVHETRQHQAMERALKAAGLPPDAIDSEEFQTFRSDFEADNKGFSDLFAKNTGTAAKWLASEYARIGKKASRRPAGDGSETTLERGGGVSLGVGGAASQVKISRHDPQKYEKILKALDQGHRPVDDNGNPYPTKR